MGFFLLNGQYSSTIVINGQNKIISKIGSERVFYDCQTREIIQIGFDRVAYDRVRQCIETIGSMEVLYDGFTGRMSSVGALTVEYDESTGAIQKIGDNLVYYADAPTVYEPIEDSYYSPIKDGTSTSNANAQTLGSIGLSFESTNRQRMAEWVGDLSNPSKNDSALFKIEYNLGEEFKAADQFSKGYCDEAIKLGAVKKLVAVLGESAPIKRRAQVALLTLAKCSELVHGKAFAVQIAAEAGLVIASMQHLFSNYTQCWNTANQSERAKLETELANAVGLFWILPHTDYHVQHIILNKKLILFLAQAAKDYPQLAQSITERLEHIKTLNSTYKNAVVRAICLAQTPLPFTVDQLKSYYIQHSFWSRQTNIFQNIGTDRRSLDTLLANLQSRATDNSDGASSQTLIHFKIK